ncbi:tail fiber assembly protein [Aeromonas jandaei]
MRNDGYNIETKNQRKINSIGAIHDNETLLKPDSIHDKWDGEKWLHDADAEKEAAIAIATETRNSLLAIANQKIAVLADAVELGMATDEEQEAYTAWRRYRVELTRLDLTVSPIKWPEQPQ